MKEEIRNAPINDSMKRQLETLRNSTAFFNILNRTPSEVSWNISLDQMEEIVYNTAAEFLGAKEIVTVTINNRGKSREPECLVWIRKDSRHRVDSTVRGKGDQVFSPTVNRYSEELKRFCEQFAPTERPDGTPINRKKMVQERDPDDRTDKNIKGIVISVSRVLYRVFDVENRAFLDTYGRDVSAPRCELSCKVLMNSMADGTKRVFAFRVTKRVQNSEHRRPSARPAFRDRQDEDDD